MDASTSAYDDRDLLEVLHFKVRVSNLHEIIGDLLLKNQLLRDRLHVHEAGKTILEGDS